MVKIVKFVKNDLIGGIVYNVGDVAGFEDRVSDNLIKKEYAVLDGDGRVKKVGERLPPSVGEFGYEGPVGSLSLGKAGRAA